MIMELYEISLKYIWLPILNYGISAAPTSLRGMGVGKTLKNKIAMRYDEKYRTKENIINLNQFEFHIIYCRRSK